MLRGFRKTVRGEMANVRQKRSDPFSFATMPNRISTVQECDARDDESRHKAGNQKVKRSDRKWSIYPLGQTGWATEL